VYMFTIYRGMERHLLSKSHINVTAPKVNNKLTKFNQYKDENNCCHKCYRTKIADSYFNKLTNICNACNEIELNQDKLCRPDASAVQPTVQP